MSNLPILVTWRGVCAVVWLWVDTRLLFRLIQEARHRTMAAGGRGDTGCAPLPI